ncbi:MAG: PocR ligand-binding domain-containing protein [Planctomycetota bacterium]
MPISSETLSSALLQDPCFADLVEALIGPFSAYAIVPANAPVYIFEGRGRFGDFCSAIRSKDRGQSCMACDMSMGQMASQAGQTVVYMCHAGLLDMAAPISLGSQHVATIFCGQRRFADEERDRASRERAAEVEARLGFEPGALMHLWDKIEPLAEEETNQVSRRLNLLSRYVAQSLERIDRVEQTQRHSARLLAALRAIAAMHATSDPQALFENIVIEIADGLALDTCALAVREFPYRPWEIRAALTDTWVGTGVVPCVQCHHTVAMLDRGQTQWIGPDDHCPFHALTTPTSAGLLLMPIPPTAKARGMLLLGLDVPWDNMDQHRKDLVSTLGVHAGLSLNNLILREHVEKLTGHAVTFAAGALGRTLAAPLAHEVHNGLQNILGAARRLSEQIKSPPGSDDRSLMNRLTAESERLARLVKSMMDVTKDLAPMNRWFYLNDIIEETTELARVVAST